MFLTTSVVNLKPAQKLVSECVTYIPFRALFEHDINLKMLLPSRVMNKNLCFEGVLTFGNPELMLKSFPDKISLIRT